MIICRNHIPLNHIKLSQRADFFLARNYQYNDLLVKSIFFNFCTMEANMILKLSIFKKGDDCKKMSICTDWLIEFLFIVNRSLLIKGHHHCQQSDSNFRCLLSAVSIWVGRFILLCNACYSYPDPNGISIHCWHLKIFSSNLTQSLWTKAFLGEGNSSSQFLSQGYRMVKIVTLLISKNKFFSSKTHISVVRGVRLFQQRSMSFSKWR